MPADSVIKKLFPNGSRRRSMVNQFLEIPIPPDLVKNHLSLTGEGQKALQNVLVNRFFTDTSYYPDPPEVYLATECGRSDLRDHLSGRLGSFRSVVVPWLNASIPLKGKRILEIGAGTGASTVALAEQGRRYWVSM